MHGDDITSDSNGEDCYRFVKEAGRFKVVKRTPGISTTDLVGRMLLCTKTHFIKDLDAVLDGREGGGSQEEKARVGAEMKERITEYATDASGNSPLVDVWTWHSDKISSERRQSSATKQAPVHNSSEEQGTFVKKVEGKQPQPGQRVIYVDGGFDLFSSGHIEFLRKVIESEEAEAKQKGWNKPYSPVYLVAGVHNDETINYWKGVNYPIMNIFERGLCVLQCKVRTRPSNTHLFKSKRGTSLTSHPPPVHLRSNLFSPFHTKHTLPLHSPLHPSSRLSWPHNLFCPRHPRPLHRRPQHGHSARSTLTLVLACQCH